MSYSPIKIDNGVVFLSLIIRSIGTNPK